MVDPFNLDQYEKIREELYEVGIRLNEEPPNVKIQGKESGGLDISSTVDLETSKEEIRTVLKENGIVNAEILIRENLDTDGLIDAVMSNREYLPALALVNKIDLVDEDSMTEIREYVDSEVEEDVLYISAESRNLEDLKERIFEELGFIQIYLKPQGEEADMEEPMIIQKGAVVEDLCRKIHRDLVDEFKFARIWGESAKHPRQEVGKDHELSDGDVVSVIS